MSSPVLSRLRGRITVSRVFWLAVWTFILVKLGPHLGAVAGVRTAEPLAPDWSATTLDGRTISAADLRGRVVLVNFWATWCLPCRAEMPLLERMWRRHASEGFVLVGLSVDRAGPAVVRAWLEERGVTYPVAIVGGAVEQGFGGIRGIPTSFLLDRSGRIVHRVVGPLAPASLELAVRRLLSRPPGGA